MKMKGSQNISCIVALLALFLPGITIAEELPNGSLLQRYGVTDDQLPKPPLDKLEEAAPSKYNFQKDKDPLVKLRIDKGKSWPSTPHNFQIGKEDPAIEFRIDESEPRPPIPTGNISIDNINSRNFKECTRAREATSKFEKEYIKCN